MLEAGGVRLLERTLNTPDALKILSSWRRNFPDIREVRAPLGHIPLIAVNGVNAQNARAYLNAGCVGLGSSLLDLEKVRAGDFDGVGLDAENFVRALEG